MGKYFGTDGFRGEANVNLTVDHARKVGRFLGWYYGQLKKQAGDDAPAKIVIGKDTRRSSYMFESALVAGLTASGADAYLLHVTTTPSVAYVARTEDLISYGQYVENGCVYFTEVGIQEYIAKCTHRAKPMERAATYRKPRSFRR